MDLLRLAASALFHCVRVGKFFGIPVLIHWSFWIIPVGFFVATLSQGFAAAACMFALILFFFAQGVVLHEYGHALAARVFGVKTRDIILTPLGGIARMESMPENPVHEIIIALAGPAVNVVCAIGMIVLLVVLGRGPSPTMSGDHPYLSAWIDYVYMLMALNVVMVGFNMLPAFPSDGGRVFRAVLSLFLSRLSATQVAVYTGAVVALALAIYGTAHGAIQMPFIAILFAFMGQMELWMLRRQAEMQRRPRVQSAPILSDRAAYYDPPEPEFSGYSWDAHSNAWIEWRDGVAVRKCRMRLG